MNKDACDDCVDPFRKIIAANAFINYNYYIRRDSILSIIIIQNPSG